ncbi:GGDEF domain-containing protein [Methylomonas rapida]|uniref:diguanylate cyclase n=1 Tax=Methylomonas rapida TaxID=2963939 RepID=A0ABY7GQH4_9GAMM|nr:GGDEF domain-containing protein [Methylomonas rapida]WAR46763.1 GGDEF domain-containing protein [Methylomonas rapida]
MKGRNAASGLPNILKKLGAMTAIRDTYMVEQSLLRTLGPLLGVLETSFYRVEDNGDVIRALYHSRKVVEKQGAKRVVDNIEEVSNEQEIPDILRNLFESVRLLRKCCSRRSENNLLICYPIYGKNELVGYFVFQRDREVTPVEDAIVQGVLEVFTNYFDLLDTSQRDQLTGLLNRYSLESNLDRLWSILAARQNDSKGEQDKRIVKPECYWICVLDIDHFKKINDEFGHVIGDEVLIIITRLLESSFRQSDLLYRYGGEEFVAIIAANDLDAATQALERARHKIEKFEFPQVGHITISGGFSCADLSVLPQEIFNRADSSLYAAKKAGRNRICFYDNLVAEGVLKEVAAGSIDLF